MTNEFSFSFRGETITYEMKELSATRIRKLTHMTAQEGPEWFIDMYIATINGKPSVEAGSKLQWLVYGDSQDFLHHLQQSIGRPDSPYEKPEVRKARKQQEAAQRKLFESLQRSGSAETT